MVVRLCPVVVPRLQEISGLWQPKGLRHIFGATIAILMLLTGLTVAAQTPPVKGTVYDRSQLFVLPGVSVMSTSGKGTVTDSLGNYELHLTPKDSIYFSYLGKSTPKFPVRTMPLGYNFNISLAVRVDSLPMVVVRPKLYRYDSAENRDEYRKVFDYQAESPIGYGEGGVGLSLDAIFNAKKNRQMLALQQRLVEEEHDKYIDYRFNKLLVKKITGLQKPQLDTFMRLFRPTYEFIQNCENDYEFYKYIKNCGIYFTQAWRREHNAM